MLERTFADGFYIPVNEWRWVVMRRSISTVIILLVMTNIICGNRWIGTIAG